MIALVAEVVRVINLTVLHTARCTATKLSHFFSRPAALELSVFLIHAEVINWRVVWQERKRWGEKKFLSAWNELSLSLLKLET